MTKQSLPNKHDIATSFFKLVDFQPASNWHSLLLLNTASSLEKILDPTGSASGTQRILRQSQNGLPVKGGPLSLLTSSTNDHFGVIQAIKKRKAKSRFCEKLTYEDFELFIFVENRKLVSLIIDPHQFLNAFDAKKIAKEMDEKEECIQELIKLYKKNNNLSHHLLFKTINELWENDSEINNREEFLFDLLPSLITLYNFSGFDLQTIYLNSSKLLSGRELFKKNRFCLKTGTYLPNYGLFKSKTDYKDFNTGNIKCPLARRLTIRVALKDSEGNDLDGDSINRAKSQLLEQKAELIKSNFVREKCLSKYKNGKNFALDGYFPENDEHVKKLFELHKKNRKLNTGLLFELCRNGVLLHLNFSENNYGFDLVCITINPDAFQSFLREKLYKQKKQNTTQPPSIQPANLLFCSEWYLENLDEYIFAVNEELNKPEHEKTIKLFAREFPNIGRIYNRQELKGRLVFGNYKKANSKDSHAYEPIFYDIGKDDGPNGNKNKFLENDSLAKY